MVSKAPLKVQGHSWLCHPQVQVTVLSSVNSHFMHLRMHYPGLFTQTHWNWRTSIKYVLCMKQRSASIIITWAHVAPVGLCALPKNSLTCGRAGDQTADPWTGWWPTPLIVPGPFQSHMWDAAVFSGSKLIKTDWVKVGKCDCSTSHFLLRLYLSCDQTRIEKWIASMSRVILI